MLIQLANSAADYGDDKGGFRIAEIKPADGRATATFENVPYGDYAVKVFHDENDNRKLDIGFRGPKEPYGFSNGARGFMRGCTRLPRDRVASLRRAEGHPHRSAMLAVVLGELGAPW